MVNRVKSLVKNVLIKIGIYSPPSAPYIIQEVDAYGERQIISGQKGNDEIKIRLLKNEPLMACRFGSVELSTIVNYLHLQEKKVKNWNKNILYALANNAGFFPVNTKNCRKFSELYIDCIQNIDLIGVWFNEGEDWVTERYCPKATLTELRGLEPYYHENPWSEVLAGKIVLVVHPFANSIQKQFEENRTHLFPNPQVLPAFTLKTLRAVQSIADNKTKLPFKDWFEALVYMQEEIHNIDFDVAIIGAGAYGLPLASFVKSIGRQAIHMGGATQILFGVFGNRWEDNEIIKGFQNKYWVRPSGEEIPEGAGKVEGACYW